MPYQPDIHPIIADTPGTVRLKLDTLVSVTEQGVTRRVPAQDLFVSMGNRVAPGFFGSEPEIASYAPGYTVELYEQAKVIWPVRDQEKHDPVVRFVPEGDEAIALFTRLQSMFEPTGALSGKE